VVAGLMAATLAMPVHAADLPSMAAPPVFVAPPMFTVVIAAGPMVEQSFPGSKAFTVLPSVHLAYLKPGEHDVFYTPDDSFDIVVFDNGIFRFGPAGNFLNRRGLSDGNGQFKGLPNVRYSIELGGFVEIWPLKDHLRIRGEIRKAVTGYDGLVGSIGGDAIGQFGPFQASIGPRFKFGDQRYADRFFTITPFEAAANGLVTPYKASGGLTSYSATLFGGYDRLASSVGASPVATVLGTRDQFTAGVTLAYRFGFKGFGVFGY
jgi:outer membrane scaffolding protein for murein synthesis (MipA/OmpV family)